MFLLGCAFLSSSINANSLTVDYIANAGVKLTAGDKVVLIDALFGPHNHFKSITAEQFDELTHQRADIALATHKHSDHFGAKRVTSFLKYNLNTLFISTPESVQQLKKVPNLKRVKTYNFEGYHSQQTSYRDVSVTTFNFPHMEPRAGQAQNFAYLVELDGWKVLHVGDADVNEEVIKAYNLAQYQIDLVLIHDLFPKRKSNFQQLIQLMNAKKVAFIHMTDEKAQPFFDWLQTNYPAGGLLVTGYEQIVMTKA